MASLRTSACSEDWLEIYILFRDGNDRFIGRYCGNTAPGPVESPRGATGIRIHLHTDAENVSSGFKGRYVFEVAKSVTGSYHVFPAERNKIFEICIHG